MTDLLASLSPTTRLLVIVVGLIVALAVLAEIGIPPIIVGTVVYAKAVTGWGWATDGAFLPAVGATLVAYIAWCLVKPRSKCIPIIGCGGDPRHHDGFGNWSNCWLCGGSGQRKRIGSKLLRRHRRFAGK